MRQRTLPVLLAVAMALFSSLAVAQSSRIAINGKVISFEESLPLEGVKIAVKEGKNITGSQSDGTFTIEVLNTDKTLLVSLAGYEHQEISLTGARDYNIVLKRNGSLALHAATKNASAHAATELIEHASH